MNSRKLVIGLFLAFSATLSAQEGSRTSYEVGLTYSGLHVNSANYDHQRTANGGSGYFAYNLSPTVALVADFGGYANTRTGIDSTLLTYMFGPRFSWRHYRRVTPYVQFLFGGAYVWDNGSTPQRTQNAIATAAGGGLDYNLTRHISIKPIQIEYVMTQIDSTRGFGSHQNDVRYSAGMVLRFGER